MHFTYVALQNFSVFSKARFDFQPNQVNWLAGANGSGKTQLIGAMLAVLVGRPAIDIEKGGTGPTVVELGIKDAGLLEIAKLEVHETTSGRVEVENSAGPLSVAILAELSRPDGQRLIFSEEDQPDFGGDVGETLAALPATIRSRPDFERFVHLRGSANYGISRGEGMLLALAIQCAIRLRATTKIPLIVDTWALDWSDQAMAIAVALVEELARVAQVIVVAPLGHAPGGTIRLVEGDRSANSLARFKGRYAPNRPRLRPLAAAKWVRGSKFNGQENRECEFKEVKGSNPVGAIKNKVDEYVVAFLNAGRPLEGAIFWGITDSDQTIVGVPLTGRDCDELRQQVTQKLLQISPPVAPTRYRLDLHPVTDRGAAVKDLYVVEVRVPSVRRTLLFATGGYEVFVKTDAGKKKLTPLELQYELLERLGVEPEF